MTALKMGNTTAGSAGDHGHRRFEEPHTRTFFYVGGGYKADEKGQHKFHNQVYVERLSPLGAIQDTPIVLIHGQGQTGTVCNGALLARRSSG